MLEVPPLPNAEAEADWAELSCLVEEKSVISRSEIEMILEEGNVQNREGTIGSIWQQINWRHSKDPNHHPIIATIGRLERLKTWKQTIPYAFMLLLSCHSFYKETEIRRNQWTATSKLFEKLVTEALKNYLGFAINIGAPRRDDVPSSFDRCLNYVCQHISERKGPKDPLIHWRKDAGVDVIAWSPIDDRSGQVIVLVQCAAGRKWVRKTSDINLKKWNKLIDFAADPIRGLAFPSVYCTSSTELEDRWLDHSWDGGILLDRLRITSLARTKTRSIKRIRNELINWSQNQIDNMLERKAV